MISSYRLQVYLYGTWRNYTSSIDDYLSVYNLFTKKTRHPTYSKNPWRIYNTTLQYVTVIFIPEGHPPIPSESSGIVQIET